MQESVLSYHVVSRDQTQILRLGLRHLPPTPVNLTDPPLFLVNTGTQHMWTYMIYTKPLFCQAVIPLKMTDIPLKISCHSVQNLYQLSISFIRVAYLQGLPVASLQLWLHSFTLFTCVFSILITLLQSYWGLAGPLISGDSQTCRLSHYLFSLLGMLCPAEQFV